MVCFQIGFIHSKTEYSILKNDLKRFEKLQIIQSIYFGEYIYATEDVKIPVHKIIFWVQLYFHTVGTLKLRGNI